jgi:transcriptional regulator with XRE-family HTH domain
LTLRDLGERIGRNSGVLSRYETGDRTPKPEDVAQLLTAMRVRGGEYEDVMTLAYDTDAPQWTAWTLPEQRQHLAALLDAEQNARTIVAAQPTLFPGLIQSKAYMTAIMSGGGLTPDEVLTRVAIRLGRREAITGDSPADFVALVGEAALHLMIGGSKVMAEQLRHTLELCKRPNIQVFVTPFRAGWQPGLEGAFMILDSSIVHIENRVSGVFLHEESAVQSYLEAIDTIRRASYGEAESKAILTARINELERT